ncbi:MAG: 7-cyano-7-deazaguanine synthase QueC [Alphaproteobacteria bacterium CG11_big_fil_rev_8_21_14_0_20_44_7]|nr:MAG: 7-cyano-7-deazaguanine synthase QueC [Alphaproteobacteria bacterium CG11_big_fil_rev_8_21_14_0_20_44_7]
MSKKAVILLSGGLDSLTTFAIARDKGFECLALSFDYGQRHAIELEKAKKIALIHAAEHKIIRIDNFGGSALVDNGIAVPKQGISEEIPTTYVPARNTIFLSYALAYAEVLAADDIFIGVNALDYSGYPDCRPEFINAYEEMANLATKRGVEGKKLTIHTPLINLTKAEIIKAGLALDVDYALSTSCYDPIQEKACGACDSCRLRLKGFEEAGITDPIEYY